MASIVIFNRILGPVLLDCVISEKHNVALDITEIPVETGVRITDHAFVLPKKLTLDIATGSATAAYNALVAFQETRIPFSFVSGLFLYTNMLIKSISAERDKTFSDVLKCSVDLQEIVMVSTGYAADTAGTSSQSPNSTSSGDDATADRTASTTQRGDTTAASTVPSGNDTTTASPTDDQSLLSRVI